MVSANTPYCMKRHRRRFIIKFPDRTYLAISQSYVQYLLLFIWVYWVTVVCESVESFDLGRVYLEAQTYATDFSLIEMIGFRILRNVDFIYYLILYVAVKLSIPLNFVTALIVTSYYLLVINAVRRITKVQLSEPILLTFLFATPMIWVVAISRNLTAAVFFYLAVTAYYREKKGWTALFMIASVLTHFSFLMYVLVFLASAYCRKIRLQPHCVMLTLALVIVVSFLAPSILQSLISRLVTSRGLGYESYATAASFNYLTFGSVNYADKVPVTFAFIYSVYLLFLNRRKYGFEYWALFILTCMLAFFLNSSWTLINRCMMIMTIFWALNVGRIVKRATIRDINDLNRISLFGLLSIVLQLYGNRHLYFGLS